MFRKIAPHQQLQRKKAREREIAGVSSINTWKLSDQTVDELEIFSAPTKAA
jgi:hypothetical protein